MTPRERALAVYRGDTPDRVPLFLDLSHWYRRNRGVPFDLAGFPGVEAGLVDLHRTIGAIAYVEMGSFYDLSYDDPSVEERAWTIGGVYRHELKTPIGTVWEERRFSPASYSYNISHRLLQSTDDFDVVLYAMERRRVRPRYDRYEAWQTAHGERAFIYMQLPYSGLGYLMSRYMGVERSVYAIYDRPDRVGALVDGVNTANLKILDAIADGPFDVLFQSDNLDGNVQTPSLFSRYSAPYYAELCDRMHRQGKYVSVHVDGEMRGLLGPLAACGVDCIDAATPAPMFSLSPHEAREAAGDEMILSGGIPATVFGARGTDAEFDRAVIEWLTTRTASSRLILAAGDQVPPDAPWDRIIRLPDLIDQHGRYD